ncbi:DUF6468 domain-containing protein [Roseospira goensis]|uniref:DUF6468 domain-containing protein n=1 Tax=Roseospira goensis TaxID=391922 RepID=A0A7W6S265_9PROT|nr:DUF6468 domain-containing protein [Roseospira goensis]MBB4287035.1 hypothetical protein [Roseospira goensis]
MSLSLILDIVIVALLVPTIVFAWILNGRLADLRRNRDELARLIGNFNEATHRAESGIPKLRKAADDAGRALQDRVEKAQTLRDDLAFMVDRAESVLGTLEDGTRAGRGAGSGVRATPRPGERRGRGGGTAGAAPASGPSVPAPPPVPGRAGGGERPAPVTEDTDDDFFVEDERSDAERELLRALQSVR